MQSRPGGGLFPAEDTSRVIRASDEPDPARGGYFTVQDMRGNPGGRHDFNVRGYDRRGNLLLHTWHVGEASMRTECDAWRSRGAYERPFRPTE